MFVFSFLEAADMLKKVSVGDDVERNYLKTLLGGKGFNLAKMTLMGLPVPPGFIVTTEAFKKYRENKALSVEVMSEIKFNIKVLEREVDKVFVSGSDFEEKGVPLLVSVRSGAKFSMPGMLDTILNLGLNDNCAKRMLKLTGNKKFVFDTYARFVQMFSTVVGKVSKLEFNALGDLLEFEDILKYKDIYRKSTLEEFPNDPYDQLESAIKSVFDSWDNSRAIFYREINNIDHNLGTAVNVQSMVFGNFGKNSGTGVGFSRNPITGENKLFGEYLINAQGEDVVSGHRTPIPISKLKKSNFSIYEKFRSYSELLETEFKDMQDIEFTVENDKFYILQTRVGKRSPQAAIKICVDLINEKKITPEEGILRINPEQIEHFIYPSFNVDELSKLVPVAVGLPASPGAVTGKVVFNAVDAKKEALKGENVILVRKETSPEDIEGMQFSSGVLTSCGGMTSHAAVVARGMGKSCIVGCEQISIEEDKGYFFAKKEPAKKIKKGDVISLDCASGNLYPGEIKKHFKKFTKDFEIFMSYVDSISSIQVYANADNSSDVKKALEFGASGIGLCRTEHMFFREERIKIMREMILTKDMAKRTEAIEKLLEFQKEDFIRMFLEVQERPITIRLLDPPLHEFLPRTEEAQLPLLKDLGMNLSQLKSAVDDLDEFNPMMGHRGARLLISYPELIAMQTKAIIISAIEVSLSKKMKITPEIMVPLIGKEEEISFVVNIIRKTAHSIINEFKFDLNYKIGTMIELPRAALIADKLAKHVDFFSFGTNDLTQMTFGISRDDASKFLKNYYEKNIYEFDPFVRIDTEGVGSLLKIAIERGRKVKKNLKIGVCGEHGGDHFSIDFFEKIGVNYVSCSAFRVLTARFSAAQAHIKGKMIVDEK